MWLKKIKRIDLFLVLSFLIGLIPASFIIHIIAKDFTGFYNQALSFLKVHGFSYQILTNYCDNPINTGVNARAPFVPLLLAITISLFGRNLLGIYLPFFIARILILPLTYLIGSFLLPKRYAFLASLFLIFIPKLQTYSFGAFEADIYVAFLYAVSIYYYFKSNNLKIAKNAYLSALFLGLGALTKSTGFSIALGFILGVILENLEKLKNISYRKTLIVFVGIFTLLLGPYLIWTLIAHRQLYTSTHFDKSIFYIKDNLPVLVKTIPLYLGINFNLGLKGKITSLLLLVIFIAGFLKALIDKRYYVLIFPVLVTLVLISTLSSCLIGVAIPASYQLITILGFSMIPVVIIFISGALTLINFSWRKFFKTKCPKLIILIFMLLLLYKFVNNYFSARYALYYIPNEYYVSLPTVLKNKEEMPDISFKVENGLRLFVGPSIHKTLSEQLSDYRFDPFSPFYKNLVLFFVFWAIVLFIFSKTDA